MKRCQWAYNERLMKYHDEVWGKPEHDERQLYKMLILEGLQAGLSWDTILKKEDLYDQALDHFDYHLIEGNLSLVIQAYVYGVLDDEDRVIDTVEQENQLDSAEEIEKLLREEEKIIDVVEQQDSSIDESAIPEKPEEVPVLNEDDQEDLGTYYFYVVQDGDSYETIAKHYQVDEYALKSYNHERSLTSGTIVIIPFVI